MREKPAMAKLRKYSDPIYDIDLPRSHGRRMYADGRVEDWDAENERWVTMGEEAKPYLIFSHKWAGKNGLHQPSWYSENAEGYTQCSLVAGRFTEERAKRETKAAHGVTEAVFIGSAESGLPTRFRELLKNWAPWEVKLWAERNAQCLTIKTILREWRKERDWLEKLLAESDRKGKELCCVVGPLMLALKSGREDDKKVAFDVADSIHAEFPSILEERDRLKDIVDRFVFFRPAILAKNFRIDSPPMIELFDDAEKLLKGESDGA